MKKILPVFCTLVIIYSPARAQWEQMPSSPIGTIDDIIEADGVLYLAGLNNGVYRSTDSTMSWELINNGLDSNQARFVFQLLEYESDIYAATIDGIYKSTDGGDSWVRKSDGILIGNGSLYASTLSIFEYNNTLFTGAWTGIYRSTNGGDIWLTTNVSGGGVAPQFFINHNGILFGARESNNAPYGYKSTDGGITWETLTSIPVPSITFCSENDNLWAGTIHGIWLSGDNGVSWVEKNNGLPSDPYSTTILRLNGNLITSLKFGGSGVFRSTDEGMFWEDIGDGLPFLNTIDDLIIYGDKIIAATGQGLWQRDTMEVATGIELGENMYPESHEITRNYPNPFNSKTTLVYYISQPSNVIIEIYDILGRLSETIENNGVSAGQHRVVWNAEGKPSGVYYYRLVNEGYSEVGRMILLK